MLGFELTFFWEVLIAWAVLGAVGAILSLLSGDWIKQDDV